MLEAVPPRLDPDRGTPAALVPLCAFELSDFPGATAATSAAKPAVRAAVAAMIQRRARRTRARAASRMRVASLRIFDGTIGLGNQWSVRAI
jgi:hypothetical protein